MTALVVAKSDRLRPAAMCPVELLNASSTSMMSLSAEIMPASVEGASTSMLLSMVWASFHTSSPSPLISLTQREAW